MGRMSGVARPNQSRRDLFQRSGLTIPAALLPPNATMAEQSAGIAEPGQPISPVMAELSAYMSEARSRTRWWRRRSSTFSIPWPR